MTSVPLSTVAAPPCECYPGSRRLDGNPPGDVEGFGGQTSIERRVASADHSLNRVRGPHSRGAGAAPSMPSADLSASLSQKLGRQSAPRSFSSRVVQAPYRNGGCAGSLPGSSDGYAPTRPRKDALPENIMYGDNGCDLHGRCLSCPLPDCRYGFPGGARAIRNRDRDAEIIRLRQSGLPAREIAKGLGLHKRTVYRVLAQAREIARR